MTVLQEELYDTQRREVGHALQGRRAGRGLRERKERLDRAFPMVSVGGDAWGHRGRGIGPAFLAWPQVRNAEGSGLDERQRGSGGDSGL